MSRVEGAGTAYEQINLYVVEVYYDNDNSKIIGWTEKESVYGESLDELRQTLTWMLESLDKPVLDEAVLLAEAEAARENGEGEEIFTGEYLTLDEVLDSLGLEREDLGETNSLSHAEEAPLEDYLPIKPPHTEDPSLKDPK